MGPSPTAEELSSFLVQALRKRLDPRELRRRGDEGLREIVRAAAPLLSSLPGSGLALRIHDPGGTRSGRSVIELAMRDQPFIVDTFRLTLRRLGLRDLSVLHAVLPIGRDESGEIVALGKHAVPDDREAFVYAEVPLIKSRSQRSSVEAELTRTFRGVRDVVSDHGLMVDAIRRHISALDPSTAGDGLSTEEVGHLKHLLQWLADDNFVFLGYRSYRVGRRGAGWTLQDVPESGLGLLRDRERSRFGELVVGDAIPAAIRSRLAEQGLVFLDKSRMASTIHRAGRLDNLTIKCLDEAGLVVGFGKFLGLLTYKATRTRGSSLPILSSRRERVLAEITAEPGSHTYKAAIEAYDSLPIEFLFSFATGEVTRVVQRIVRSIEHPEVGVCVVRDPLERSFFVSVTLPLRLYDEDLRRDIHDLLARDWGATYLDDRTSFLDDEIALLHFFCDSAEPLELERVEELEAELRDRATSWHDRFEAALLESQPADQAYPVAETYGLAFPKEYRIVTFAGDAVADVARLERLRRGESGIELSLSEQLEGLREGTLLKVYVTAQPYLTDLLPVLGHFGLRVIDATLTAIELAHAHPLWIVTFRIERLFASSSSDGESEAGLLAGLRSVLCGQMEADPLNSLILSVGLTWREVQLLRTYHAFACQIGAPPGRRFVAATLSQHPAATRSLLELFDARFNPLLELDRDAAQATVRTELARHRESIRTADEDRVFELLENLVDATVRTSFFMPQQRSPGRIAVKIDSRRVTSMPRPRPHTEIFVHSAELQGVHLRSGPVARGGIRWSDRPQDLRTEILGLMKTQTTKNGLIVPGGAKGGFILKWREGDGQLEQREVDRSYADFISSLLALTDNIRGDRILSPDGVVCHDAADPYLFVAADRGTAHLSDVANSLAEERDYWLHDAFASGGRYGYDHKKEGITARGAWLCVERHFLELGTNIEHEPFSMVGIGDMSGDVFGNGLLLARRARLVAAFNHQHVFLDPDPDPEGSWQERRRLFELSRSSWEDYESAKLSEGGGIFERGARAIPLTPEVRKMLACEQEVLSGEELIRAILSAPVDLIWNGGIGTYIKASHESHADVGDRTNAAVRVDARDLRARVIGEGGNLGLTQAARVEYALAGGRINTDAIDNSGGVDLSDHEVSFKILLAPLLERDRISLEERNRTLRGCVSQAAAAVLAHNEAQSLCISLDLLRGRADPDRIVLAAEFLAERGELDLVLEGLPDREALHLRGREGGLPRCYTRPELAILLGHSKLVAKRELLEHAVLDDPSLEELLLGYFPPDLRERFPDEIRSHRLRRELVATCLVNQVIDRAGVTLIPEIVRTLGVGISDVVLAAFLVDRLLSVDELREALRDAPVSEEDRLQVTFEVEAAVRSAVFGFLALERRALLEAAELIRWRDLSRGLRDLVRVSLSDSDRPKPLLDLAALGFDPELCSGIETLWLTAERLTLVRLAITCGEKLARVVELHDRLAAASCSDWLIARVRTLEHVDAWDRIALEALLVETLETQHRLTRELLQQGDGDAALAEFQLRNAAPLEGIRHTIEQIDASEQRGVSPLAVLSQQIRRLC